MGGECVNGGNFRSLVGGYLTVTGEKKTKVDQKEGTLAQIVARQERRTSILGKKREGRENGALQGKRILLLGKKTFIGKGWRNFRRRSPQRGSKKKESSEAELHRSKGCRLTRIGMDVQWGHPPNSRWKKKGKAAIKTHGGELEMKGMQF